MGPLGISSNFFFHIERNNWSFHQATFASVAMVCPPPRKALTSERLGSPAECEGLLTKKTYTHTHTRTENKVKSSCWK